MKTLAEEFERPALFMLQRYGHQAEDIAVSWAIALEADGLTEPANHWRSVAGCDSIRRGVECPALEVCHG